jgi:hypothetical protein
MPRTRRPLRAIVMPPARMVCTTFADMRTTRPATSHMTANEGTENCDLGAPDAVDHSRIMNGSVTTRPISAAKPIRLSLLIARVLSRHSHQVAGRSSEPNFGVRATTPLTIAASNGTKKTTIPIVAHGTTNGRPD